MNYFGIYNLIQGDSVIRKSKEKNKFILGNYENKKYFDDIKEMLQTEIIPKKVNDIVNIGLHFFHKDVRPYAASCCEA